MDSRIFGLIAKNETLIFLSIPLWIQARPRQSLLAYSLRPLALSIPLWIQERAVNFFVAVRQGFLSIPLWIQVFRGLTMRAMKLRVYPFNSIMDSRGHLLACVEKALAMLEYFQFHYGFKTAIFSHRRRGRRCCRLSIPLWIQAPIFTS